MLRAQIPTGPKKSVLVEQSGVLATLSRWRPWVQIPPGTLVGTVRKPAKRPSSNLGDRLWVRFPPVLFEICVGRALASLSGCNPPAFSLCRFNSCPTHCWPVRLSVRGHRPLKPGGWVRFPYGLLIDQVVEQVDTRRSERRASLAWEFDSPLGHCGVDWSLVSSTVS
jgi:hypothetical protein